MTTIRDVAKLAGVSPSTASRAMHDSNLISEKTKKKVRKAMEELNFSPNYAAQSLANRFSKIIGVILPIREESVGNNPFFIQILQGISTICNAHDYIVSLATGQKEEELIQNIDNLINRGNVKNFIFLYSKENDAILEYVKKQKDVFYVIVGKPYDNIESTSYVDNDNIQASSDATNYLINKGHQNICYVYTNLDEMVQDDRYVGYRLAVKEKLFNSYKLNFSSDNREENKEKLLTFIKANPQVNGIVACDDITGLTVQQILIESGIDLEKYEIVTFNNSIYTQIAKPMITAVEIFPRFLGSEAAVLAINNGQKTLDVGTKHIIVPHKIIEH